VDGELRALVKTLEKTGLYVRRAAGLHVARPLGRAPSQYDDPPDVREVSCHGSRIFVFDHTFIDGRGNGWVFRNAVGCVIGGIDHDHFQYFTSDLERLETAVIDYYFGAPTKLGDFSAPFHRHPEWPREKIEAAFATAPWLTESQWQQIRKPIEDEETKRRDAWPRQGINPPEMPPQLDLLFYVIVSDRVDAIFIFRFDGEQACFQRVDDSSVEAGFGDGEERGK
jgi:hypothetical protein